MFTASAPSLYPSPAVTHWESALHKGYTDFLSRALPLILVQSPPLMVQGDRIPKPRRISAELCEVFLLPALMGTKLKLSILQPGVMLCPKCPQSSRTWSAWQ